MNLLDAVLILPIVIMAISGFNNGFIKELASFAALVLGIYFAIYFSDVVAGFLMKTFDISHRYVFILAFLITFVGVVLLVSLIGKLLDKIAALVALGLINKIFGLVFGLFKGVLIMSIFLVIFNMIDTKEHILKSEHKKGSLLYQPLFQVAPLILINIQNIDFSDPSWDDYQDKVKEKELDKMV
jgi:membrane protein required for colicin V production